MRDMGCCIAASLHLPSRLSSRDGFALAESFVQRPKILTSGHRSQTSGRADEQTSRRADERLCACSTATMAALAPTRSLFVRTVAAPMRALLFKPDRPMQPHMHAVVLEPSCFCPSPGACRALEPVPSVHPGFCAFRLFSGPPKARPEAVRRHALRAPQSRPLLPY